MTNQNQNQTRDAYIERARETAMHLADDWFEEDMTEEARELTGDVNARPHYSLSYSQGDGACISAMAAVSRAGKGRPLNCYGLARKAWETLTGVQRRALGKFLEHGGRIECWTEHGGGLYSHCFSTESHCAWERYNSAGLFSYDTDDFSNAAGGEATLQALIDLEAAVHEAIRQAGRELAAWGYAVLERVQDEAAEAAAEDWDAEHADEGGQV